MPSTHTLIIGAGQAGLAISRCLMDAAIDHVVLERGRTAERWRSERWDSLRLLTPNWASRLPGWRYRGPHPDDFMTAGELVRYLADYGASFAAPIQERSTVRSVRRTDDDFLVDTDDTTWRARNVVIATGWCDVPRVPDLAPHLHPSVVQVTTRDYRNPATVPDGTVLVVGSSATGVQLADELARAGRSVVLAVGRHSRLPRRYRGMDIWWWMERIGTFSATIDQVSDPATARAEGAVQLVGSPEHRDVDLPTLQRAGVRLAGRLTSIEGRRIRFADDLVATTGVADSRLTRLLAQIDDHIERHGLGAEVLDKTTPEPIDPRRAPAGLDLVSDRISAVVWATGYRRAYPWLHVPVLDGHGEIIQRRGVTPVPGLYVLGQRFQHRRDSNFIDGVRHDAAQLAVRITNPRNRVPS
jgi:putative flavoprotein involved in K+ transport